MTVNNEWKTIPLYPDYEITRDGDIRRIGAKVNIPVGENGRVDLDGATGETRNRSISYLKYITFNRESVEPQELEVSRVGESLGRQYLEQLSSSIGLPAEVCEALLKHGWSLEVSLGAPAMWIQGGPRKAVVHNV